MAITVFIPETFRIPRKTKLKHNKKRTNKRRGIFEAESKT